MPEGAARAATRPRAASASTSRSTDFDFASCDYYAKHGQMMPDRLEGADRRP
jgi:hypothetical protein